MSRMLHKNGSAQMEHHGRVLKAAVTRRRSLTRKQPVRHSSTFANEHGGAWTRNTKEDASYPAPTFVGRGAAYLVPDFASLKTARLPDMVENCRRALEWTVRNAACFGGDPNRVFLSGHSSGAHLAACMLITDWTTRGLPADAIKGGLLMSGMYDLYPVLLSSRGTFVHVTAAAEAALSPMRHLNRITCPIAIVSADEDSPEFKTPIGGLRRSAPGNGAAGKPHRGVRRKSLPGTRAACSARQHRQPCGVLVDGVVTGAALWPPNSTFWPIQSTSSDALFLSVVSPAVSEEISTAPIALFLCGDGGEESSHGGRDLFSAEAEDP